jgi:hypothetical protein
MASVFASFANAFDYSVHAQSRDAYEIDVTGCRYAQFYKELGEPELGFLLVCGSDSVRRRFWSRHGSYLPSLFLRPLSEIPTGGVPGLLMLCILVVFPVLAASAAVLAIRGQRLRIAAVLVSVQPFIWLLTVIGFAIGVANYGF